MTGTLVPGPVTPFVEDTGAVVPGPSVDPVAVGILEISVSSDVVAGGVTTVCADVRSPAMEVAAVSREDSTEDTEAAAVPVAVAPTDCAELTSDKMEDAALRADVSEFTVAVSADGVALSAVDRPTIIAALEVGFVGEAVSDTLVGTLATVVPVFAVTDTDVAEGDAAVVSVLTVAGAEVADGDAAVLTTDPVDKVLPEVPGSLVADTVGAEDTTDGVVTTAGVVEGSVGATDDAGVVTTTGVLDGSVLAAADVAGVVTITGVVEGLVGTAEVAGVVTTTGVDAGSDVTGVADDAGVVLMIADVALPSCESTEFTEPSEVEAAAAVVDTTAGSAVDEGFVPFTSLFTIRG